MNKHEKLARNRQRAQETIRALQLARASARTLWRTVAGSRFEDAIDDTPLPTHNTGLHLSTATTSSCDFAHINDNIREAARKLALFELHARAKHWSAAGRAYTRVQQLISTAEGQSQGICGRQGKVKKARSKGRVWYLRHNRRRFFASYAT